MRSLAGALSIDTTAGGSPSALARRAGWIISLLVLYGCGGGGGSDSPGKDEVDAGGRVLLERPPNSSCLAPERPAVGSIGLTLEPAFTELTVERPLYLLQAPSDAEHWYIIEQPGRVLRFSGNGADAAVVLDIRDRVDDGPNEAGLLGLAFHPDFAANGQVFISYTGNDGGLESRISRFQAADGGASIDAGSETVLLRQPQFAGNHNGGWIGFGPDDFLYIAFGDGGGGGDPQRTGQDTNTWLGKLLRIDVDGQAPFGIPADNPFVNGGGRPEIYAYGFRNPWRMSFDSATGRLWAGDVGQGEVEEVDIVERGGNYGWSIKEGTRCFRDADCDEAGLIDPVAEYSRDEGRSITGGFVYRGSEIPELVGAYLYGDFVSGRLWGLFPDGDRELRVEQLLETGKSIASFAQGPTGELYILDLGGEIFRIAGGELPDESDFPKRLSETGCVNPNDPTQVIEAMIPYEVNAPLWSDGAEKDRYFAIPDGTRIAIGENGDFELPIGSVLLKTFSLQGIRIETRLFVHHPDDTWAGYTYRWNDEQTDAELLSADLRVNVAGQSWLIPSRAQCMQCHTAAAGRSLGLELGQLEREVSDGAGGRVNQLERLSKLEFFSGSLPAERSAYPAYDSDAPLAERTRSYLHSNCSNCHRPEGPGRGDLDLRFSTPLAAMNVCDQVPSNGELGIEDARIVAPGAPERSVMLARMLSLAAPRMPPLATDEVDPTGTALVEGWIQAISECPQ